MPRLTEDEARAAGLDVGPARGRGDPRSKYGARRTEALDGVVYASKAEAARAAELTMMREGGVIVDFIRQPKFLLPDHASVYIADFLVIWSDGKSSHVVTVEDVKGARTPKFEADVRRWRAHGRLPLHILTKGRHGWSTETVEPATTNTRRSS